MSSREHIRPCDKFSPVPGGLLWMSLSACSTTGLTVEKSLWGVWKRETS